MLKFAKRIATKAPIETPAVSAAEPEPLTAEDSGAPASGQGGESNGSPEFAAPGDPEFAAALAGMDDDERYAIEERAAIAEFDGGLSRAAAESRALDWLAITRMDGLYVRMKAAGVSFWIEGNKVKYEAPRGLPLNDWGALESAPAEFWQLVRGELDREVIELTTAAPALDSDPWAALKSFREGN